jgi:hypothetical protein
VEQERYERQIQIRKLPTRRVIYRIYLGTDAGNPVTAFTTKDDMKAYLKRMRGTFNRPLVCRIDGDGHAPVIMTLTIAMGE